MPAPASQASPLKVCFFIPDFAYGGAQKQCILLLNELQKNPSLEITLVRFEKGAQDALLETNNLRLRFIPSRSHFDPRAIKYLLEVIDETQADILISWVRVCDIYSYFAQLVRPHLKWVLTQRTSAQPGGLRFRVRDFLGMRAHAIVSNSLIGEQYWIERRKKGPIFVVDNIAQPVDVADAEHPREAHTVLYVGRLEAQKNVMGMLGGFDKLSQLLPEVRFTICGDGTRRAEMESYVTLNSLETRIDFVGFRQDVMRLMQSHQVLVTLSNFEGLPNVLTEAVQSGVRVVASDIPEHRHILGVDYPYFVRDRHDAAESAEVMRRAIESEHTPLDLAPAREKLLSMSPSLIGNRYTAILQSVAFGPTYRSQRLDEQDRTSG